MQFFLFIADVAVIILSFLLLAKIVDEYFISSLERIADRLKLSNEAAGATLMAVGTSAPEMFITLFALIVPGQHVDLGTGTIVGSVIFNMLVIVGAVQFFRRSSLRWQSVIRDAVFYAFTLIVLIMALSDNAISTPEALLFLGMYVVYVIVVVRWKKIFGYRDVPDSMETLEKEIVSQESRWRRQKGPAAKLLSFIDKVTDSFFPDVEKSPKAVWKTFFLSIAFIAVITFVLVEASIGLANLLSIPDVIIALTVLAIGSGLPDLVSSIAVARRGRSDMAISNAFGSNIVNILVGLGLPWLIYNMFSRSSIELDSANVTGSIFLLFGSIIVAVTLFTANRFQTRRSIGVVLLALYGGYMLYNLFVLL